MARKCYFCGKSTTFGGHRKHKYGGGWEYRAQRTSKKLKPNLRKVKITKEGEDKVVDICMKCYKRMRKQEGK